MLNGKIKIFCRRRICDLESDINQFISKEIKDCEVVDIKFQIEPPYEHEDALYLAMVIYR